MNKIKIRRIGLIILLLLIILLTIFAVLNNIKSNEFYNEINALKLSYKSGPLTTNTVVFSGTTSALASIIWPGILVIFLIFAFIYAYAKKNSSQIIRKWPYIVLTILTILISLFALFGSITSGLKDTARMDSQIPANIQDQINNIYKTKYFSNIRLFVIFNLIIILLSASSSIYMLVLTIQIKNLSDIDYSKKVSGFKKEENNLP